MPKQFTFDMATEDGDDIEVHSTDHGVLVSGLSLGTLTDDEVDRLVRALCQAKRQHPGTSPATGEWWITTGELNSGGQKILGPFSSKGDALTARTYVEAHETTTFAVCQHTA